MADYHSILNRAIGGLEQNSEENRRTIYDKARNALMRQLSSLEPALSPAEISKQRLQLEEAIRDTENQFAPPPSPEAYQETSEEEADGFEVDTNATEEAEPLKPESAAPITVQEHISVSDETITNNTVETKPTPEIVVSPSQNVQHHDNAVQPQNEPPHTKEEPQEQAEKKQSTPEAIETPVISPSSPGPSSEETIISPVEEQVLEPETESTPASHPNISEKSRKLLDEADASLARVDAFRAEKASSSPLEDLKQTLEDESIEERKAPEIAISSPNEPNQEIPEIKQQPEITLDDARLIEKAGKKSGNKSLVWIVLLLILIGAGTFLYTQGEALKDPFLSLYNSVIPQDNVPSSEALPENDNQSEIDNKDQDRLLNTPLEEEPDTAFDKNVSLNDINERTQINLSENRENSEEKITEETTPAPEPASQQTAPSQQPQTTDSASTVQSNEEPAATQTPTINIFTASAILYEERQDTGRPDVSTGNVTWELDPTGSAAIGSSDLPSVRGNARIQNRDLRVRFEIMRNLDASLPASHLIEIEFQAGPLFADDNINNIAGVLMKEREQENGKQIAGAIVKVSENIFWVAMSSQAADQASNTDALKGLKWYDIPVVFASGKRAILTLEKGIAGQKATDSAFKTWETQSQ